LPPLSSSKDGPPQKARSEGQALIPETVTCAPQKEDTPNPITPTRAVDGYRARLTPRNLVKNSSQRPVIHRPHHHPKDSSLWEFRAPTRPPTRGDGRFSARSLPGPERSEARSARGRQPVKYGTNQESPEGTQDLPSKGTGIRGCTRRTGGVRAINVPRGYKWRVVLIRAWPAPRTAPTQQSADTSTGSLTTFDSPKQGEAVNRKFHLLTDAQLRADPLPHHGQSGRRRHDDSTRGGGPPKGRRVLAGRATG
jgi:hypothetical protein